MARRSRARQVALQVLFQEEINPADDPSRADRFVASRLRSESLAGFARALIAGVQEHRSALDALLEKTATNWHLERMAATDRNVLRLGAYELLHTETPARVVINEAVELAKRFGTEQSGQFVNGVLDKFLEMRCRT